MVTLDLPFVPEHAVVKIDMPKMFRKVEPGGRFFAVPGTITPDCASGNNVFTYADKLRYRATRRGGTMFFEDGTPTGGATPRTVKEGETVLLQIPSFSLPAGTTCPGKVASTAAHICASCLADGESLKVSTKGKAAKRGGNYRNASVKNAQRNRYQWVANALKSKDGRDAWVAYMIAGVRAQTRYIKMFRIHDSGDMMSAAYVAMWRRIARAAGRLVLGVHPFMARQGRGGRYPTGRRCPRVAYRAERLRPVQRPDRGRWRANGGSDLRYHRRLARPPRMA